MDIDKIINELFKDRWTGNLASANIDAQKAQLYKTLKNQVEGFWSGHSAYRLAVDGGFLLDGKSNTLKSLTHVGRAFMDDFNKNWRNDLSLNSKFKNQHR